MEGDLLLHQGCQMGLRGEIGKTGHGGHHFGQVGAAIQVTRDEAADDQVAQTPHGGRQAQAGFQVARQALLHGLAVHGLAGGLGHQGRAGRISLGPADVVAGSGGVDQGRMMNRHKRPQSSATRCKRKKTAAPPASGPSRRCRQCRQGGGRGRFPGMPADCGLTMDVKRSESGDSSLPF